MNSKQYLIQAFYIAFCEGIFSALSAIYFPNNYLVAGISCGLAAVIAIVSFNYFNFTATRIRISIKQRPIEGKKISKIRQGKVNINESSFKNFLHDENKVARYLSTLFILVGTILSLLLCYHIQSITNEIISSSELVFVYIVSTVIACVIGFLWSHLIGGIISDSYGSLKNYKFHEDAKRRIIPVNIIFIAISAYFLYRNVNIYLIAYLYFVITPLFIPNVFSD